MKKGADSRGSLERFLTAAVNTGRIWRERWQRIGKLGENIRLELVILAEELLEMF